MTDCVHEAVVAVLLGVQHAVLDDDRDGSQDEGHKQIHVNEVPGAVELPAEEREREHFFRSYLVSTHRASSDQRLQEKPNRVVIMLLKPFDPLSVFTRISWYSHSTARPSTACHVFLDYARL